MAVIVLLVGVCLAEPRLAPFLPWIVGGMIGLAIATLGTLDGGAASPVRADCSFGTDSLPLGVSVRANGGGDARGMDQRDGSAQMGMSLAFHIIFAVIAMAMPLLMERGD